MNTLSKKLKYTGVAVALCLASSSLIATPVFANEVTDQTVNTYTVDHKNLEDDIELKETNSIANNDLKETETDPNTTTDTDPNPARPEETTPTSDENNNPPSGKVMNYAVNLNLGASVGKMNLLAAEAEKLGAVVLQKYPQFSSFFVQAYKDTFADELEAKANELGINLHSVGPTRQKEIEGQEVVISRTEVNNNNTSGTNSPGGGQSNRSQLDEETPYGDPRSTFAWGLTAIGALEAAQVDVKLDRVVVGVLDTGIQGDHPDLVEQIDKDLSVGCQVNGIPNTTYEAWQDDHYHGTHVAGTVAAAHNGIGVDGVAPKARLAAVKVSNANGSFYPEYVVCGFVWSADHKFAVTNNSYYVDPWEYWVPTEKSQAAGLEVVTRAVKYAHDSGVVNVAAAGNSNQDLDNLTESHESPNDLDESEHIKNRDVRNGVDIPTMLPTTVTVSSVALPSRADAKTATLSRSSFSNYGPGYVTLAAPGSRIHSTFVAANDSYGREYASISGTSMASPHVAGVAALLRAVNPTLSVDETVALLKKHAALKYDRLAEPTDGKEYRGTGLVNALAAVLYDQPRPVLHQIQYSDDKGETWKRLENAEVSGKVMIRAVATGPVTRVELKGEDIDVSANAKGTFNERVLVETNVDFSKVQLDNPDKGKLSQLTFKAFGRNNDNRADDDSTIIVDFKIVPVELSSVKPVLVDLPIYNLLEELPSVEANKESTNIAKESPSAETNKESTNIAKKPVLVKTVTLAETGIDSTTMLTIIFLLALAGLATISRKQEN